VSSRTPSRESTSASTYPACNQPRVEQNEKSFSPLLVYRRLSELERESEDLRRKLRATQPGDLNPHPSPIALLTAAAEMGAHSRAGSHSISGSSHSPLDAYSPHLLAPNGLTHATPAPAPALDGGGTTKARRLNGVQVQAGEIDDLFQL